MNEPCDGSSDGATSSMYKCYGDNYDVLSYLRFMYIIMIAIFLCRVNGVSAQFEGIYCGLENCYDVLGVSSSSNTMEIRKAYRDLSMKLHPDRNSAPDASEKFMELANAYEILKDSDSRSEYDYALAHPRETYLNSLRYYRRRLTPKMDPRVVIGGLIFVISIGQYLLWWKRYSMALNAFFRMPQYVNQARDKAKEMGLGPQLKKLRKNEQIDFLKKNVPVHVQGGYQSPKIIDVLCVRIILSPYVFVRYIYWNINWIYRFNYMKEDFGDSEREYLARRNLDMSQARWDAMEDNDFDELWAESPWIKENAVAYLERKEQEQLDVLKARGRYKQYMRWRKKERNL